MGFQSKIQSFAVVVAGVVVINLFAQKAAKVYFSSRSPCERDAQEFVTLFGLGLALFIFPNDRRIPINDDLRTVAYYGGLMLAIRSVCAYWDRMNDHLKLAVFGICLAGVVVASRRISKNRSREDETGGKTELKSNHE